MKSAQYAKTKKKLNKQGSCEVCLIEGIEQYERDYLNRNKTKTQIIEELHIDNYKWYKHINNHVKPPVLAAVNELQPELAKDYINSMEDLLQFLELEKTKALDITKQINSGSDPRLINAWISVLAEIRKTVETIAKLSGELKTHAEVTHNTVNIEYGKVIEHVLQETCMKCKAKLSKSLPDIIKLVK